MVGVEGGWRIYSSGPGIYAKLIIGHVLGLRRQWGRRTARPLLPKALQDMTLELDSGGGGAVVTRLHAREHHGDGSALPMLVQSGSLSLKHRVDVGERPCMA